MTSHQHVPAAPRLSRREAASRHAAARQARDAGLRRVRKITWRVGLAAAAAGAIIGARFAHLTPALPNLSGDLTGGSSSSGGSSFSGGSSSAGISPSAGIPPVPASGGGVAISGGS